MPLEINTPRSDEPSPSQIARAGRGSQRQPATHHPGWAPGTTRSGAAASLLRFSELLGLPVATTFHGKGVFPDDHPHYLAPSAS